MKKIFLLLILLVFLIISCGETTGEKPENKGLAGFRVEFAEGFELGTEKSRRNDPVGLNEKIETTIKITALGYDNKPLTDYNGDVKVSMLYGKCSNQDPDSKIPLVNGYAESEIKIQYYIDKDRVVVEEVKMHEGDSEPEPTGKMGFSEFFYTTAATIPAIQSSVRGDDVHESIFSKKYGSNDFNPRNLTLEAGKGKEMVVIAVMEGGFYLQEVDKNDDDSDNDVCDDNDNSDDNDDERDVCDDNDNDDSDDKDKYACDYSSIYMYTYSTPYVDDNIEKKAKPLQVGTRIKSANGSVFEFSGFFRFAAFSCLRFFFG